MYRGLRAAVCNRLVVFDGKRERERKKKARCGEAPQVNTGADAHGSVSGLNVETSICCRIGRAEWTTEMDDRVEGGDGLGGAASSRSPPAGASGPAGLRKKIFNHFESHEEEELPFLWGFGDRHDQKGKRIVRWGGGEDKKGSGEGRSGLNFEMPNYFGREGERFW